MNSSSCSSFLDIVRSWSFREEKNELCVCPGLGLLTFTELWWALWLGAPTEVVSICLRRRKAAIIFNILKKGQKQLKLLEENKNTLFTSQAQNHLQPIFQRRPKVVCTWRTHDYTNWWSVGKKRELIKNYVYYKQLQIIAEEVQEELTAASHCDVGSQIIVAFLSTHK